MATLELDGPTLRSFGERSRGAVLQLEDEEYDEAHTEWNAMVNKGPRTIVTVNLAREYDLLLAAKGGRHNVAGIAVGNDSLITDLLPMNSVTVGPETWNPSRRLWRPMAKERIPTLFACSLGHATWTRIRSVATRNPPSTLGVCSRYERKFSQQSYRLLLHFGLS